MIISSLDHIEQQHPSAPLLKKAVGFLRSPGLADLPDGKMPIDGDRVFAIVDRYQTIPANHPKFEYHRKYIDIQFIVSGREVIGWAPAHRISVTEPYDEQKDIAFGTAPDKEWTPALLDAGHAAVLFPEDGHAPRLAAGASSPVMKIVVKVLA